MTITYQKDHPNGRLYYPDIKHDSN